MKIKSDPDTRTEIKFVTRENFNNRCRFYKNFDREINRKQTHTQYTPKAVIIVIIIQADLTAHSPIKNSETDINMR